MKVVNRFNNVFRCGYCDLQSIFYCVEPVYYNAGVYGWNCDLYIDYETDTIISTGYRNMRGASINREIIKKYDAIAREIIENNSFKDYEKLMNLLQENRKNFINEVLENA